MMGEELMPSACEVDIMGAVSMHALALASGASPAILDWNNNYGYEADLCVCTHCGNFPKSFIGDTPKISELDVPGESIGRSKCFGAVKGKVKPGPMTYFRLSSDDRAGTLKCYLGQGGFTAHPFGMGGGIATARVKDLRQLLRFVTRNGFEHHVAMVRGHHADVVAEAVTRYLNWPFYHHGQPPEPTLTQNRGGSDMDTVALIRQNAPVDAPPRLCHGPSGPAWPSRRRLFRHRHHRHPVFRRAEPRFRSICPGDERTGLMADTGRIPFVSAAACVLTGRALEQVKADIAYAGFNVKLVGQSSGVAYGELGPTLHSIEDFAWLRPLTVLAAAEETRAIVTIEEAAIRGGLGGAVAGLTAANRPVPVDGMGFPGFVPTGSVDWLFNDYGLTPVGIAAAAHRALKRVRA